MITVFNGVDHVLQITGYNQVNICMSRQIDDLANARPSDDWIKQHSGLPHLRLDVTAPVQEIMAEWQQVSHMAVEHRSSDRSQDEGNSGWKSLTLYGVHHTVTDHSDQPHAWTEVADRCPKTKQWYLDTFGEKRLRGRIRFMLVEPGGWILPHQDRQESFLSEVNVAINNPTGCEFHMLNRGKVPFRPGDVYMLDLSNRHWVVNRSDTARLHMIYHGKVPSQLVQRSYENIYYA